MAGRNPGGLPNFERLWSTKLGKELTEFLGRLRYGMIGLQGTPETPSDVQAGATADAGSSQAPAPSDHIHSAETAAPSVLVGASFSEGTGSALMRAGAGLKLGIVSAQGEMIGYSGGVPVALVAPTISKGGAFILPTVPADVTIWRAPWPCTVTAVKASMVAGTNATVNARRNGTSEHLSSDLVITPSAWADGGAVQNTAYVAGDSLEIRLKALTGAPSVVTIQIEFTRP